MAPHGLKAQVRQGQSRSPGMGFRLIYYAVMFLVAGFLIGALYLGSLLE